MGPQPSRFLEKEMDNNFFAKDDFFLSGEKKNLFGVKISSRLANDDVCDHHL